MTKLDDTINHFRKCEDHIVTIHANDKEYPVFLGSDEDGVYQIISEDGEQRFYHIEEIFEFLGIPEGAFATISIDAYWKI